MHKTRTRLNKTFVWVLKTGVLCEQGSHLHETKKSLVQGSCANKAFWKTVWSCAYKTLVQDPEPLIVPVCTIFLALRIYF